MSSVLTDPTNNFETNARSSRSSSVHYNRKPPRPEISRRVMDMEQVLFWAFREELPKSDGMSGGRQCPPAYVSPLARMVATGGVQTDNWNREPGFPSALGRPHPNAVLVEQALREVAAGGWRIGCLSGELQLIPDLPSLGPVSI